MASVGFQNLKGEIAAKGKVRDPGAVAAGGEETVRQEGDGKGRSFWPVTSWAYDAVAWTVDG